MLNEGNNNNGETFNQYFKRKIKENGYSNSLNEGKYIKHIKSFLKYFKKKQILFVFNEDIKNNPYDIYHNILKFIEVNNVNYKPQGLDKKRNSWSIKKNNSKYKILYFLMLITKKLKLFKFSIFIERINSGNKTSIEMTKDDKKELLNYYYDSVVELEKFLVKDLNHWKK